MPDDLMPASKLGPRIGVKPDTITLWARQGRIPAHRLGLRVVRFSMSEVLAALEVATSRDSAEQPALSRGDCTGRDQEAAQRTRAI